MHTPRNTAIFKPEMAKICGQSQLRKLLETVWIQIVREPDQHAFHESRLRRGKDHVHAPAERCAQLVVPAQQLDDAKARSRRLHLRLIHPFG